MWQNWITGVLGTWLIISAFTIQGNLVNELLVGMAVAILGFWTAARGISQKEGGEVTGR